MPLLKPVRKSRLISSINAKSRAAGAIREKDKAKRPVIQRPMSIQRHLRKLIMIKRLRTQAVKYLRDPLLLARVAQTGRDTVKAARAARNIKREYIPRVNDCNGVITADAYVRLQKEEAESGYDWDKYGSRNRGV